MACKQSGKFMTIGLLQKISDFINRIKTRRVMETRCNKPLTKICHITTGHRSTDIRIFIKECTSLANAGYETYLIAQGESFERNGVNVIGIGEFYNSRLKRFIMLTRIMYKEACKIDADIYHFHEPSFIPFGIKLVKKGKKVIFDSHENYAEQIRYKKWIPACLRKIVSKVYERYETYAAKRISAVITPCTRMGKDRFENRARISETISNAAVFRDVPIIERNYSVPVVCYTGTISESRGVSDIISACYIAGAKLILAGRCHDKDYLEKLKTKEQFSCVDYRGELSRDDVEKVYSECTTGIHVTRALGQYGKGDILATKVYEYMQFGLPVITEDTWYSRLIMKDYNFGVLVGQGDVSAISEAIIYLAKNPSEAKIMGKNGQRAVREKLNWKVEEEKLLELYKRLLLENREKHGE